MKGLLFFVLLFTPLQLHAQPTNLQPINVDLEIARVKKQLREIQGLTIARDQKIEMQRALLDREIANTQSKIRAIQSSTSKDQSVTSKGKGQGSDSKDAATASRDHKKAGLDNLQKMLDILRSMNPTI